MYQFCNIRVVTGVRVHKDDNRLYETNDCFVTCNCRGNDITKPYCAFCGRSNKQIEERKKLRKEIISSHFQSAHRSYEIFKDEEHYYICLTNQTVSNYHTLMNFVQLPQPIVIDVFKCDLCSANLWNPDTFGTYLIADIHTSWSNTGECIGKNTIM